MELTLEIYSCLIDLEISGILYISVLKWSNIVFNVLTWAAPTTHRDSSLTGKMNLPYSLVPHAATLRTALRAVLVPDGLKNILFFVGVVHPSGTKKYT